MPHPAIFPVLRPYPSQAGGRRRRRIPQPITRFHIPLAVLEATSHAMQRYGRERREYYVWWGGYFTSDGDGQVVTAFCPEARTTFGSIHLSNRQLVVLHTQLRDLDQVLLLELHTHPPGAGGQNEVDAANPATTYLGFVSIVVPNFAFSRFHDLRKAYVYEYRGSGRWHELRGPEIAERFLIEEPFFSVTV